MFVCANFRLPDVFFTDDFHEAFTINVDLILCVLMRTEGLVDQANRYLHVSCTFLLAIWTSIARSRKICEMIRKRNANSTGNGFTTENSGYEPRRQAVH